MIMPSPCLRIYMGSTPNPRYRREMWQAEKEGGAGCEYRKVMVIQSCTFPPVFLTKEASPPNYTKRTWIGRWGFCVQWIWPSEGDWDFLFLLIVSINCPLPYSYAPYSAFQQLGKNELRDRPWTQREGSQFQVESSQFQAVLRINRTQRLPSLPSLRPKSNPTWARNNPPFPLFFVSFIWERWDGSFQPRLNPSVHSKWKTAILRFSMNIIIQVTKGQPVKSQLIRQDNGSFVSRRLRRSVLLTERMKDNGKANKV